MKLLPTEDHVLHSLVLTCALYEEPQEPSQDPCNLPLMVQNSRAFGISTRRTNKQTRGCSFRAGVPHSFLRWVVPFLKVQSTHDKSGCAFSAVQLPPWLSREVSCTPGNKGHSVKIGIAMTNAGVVHLCVYVAVADTWTRRLTPGLYSFSSLLPMWHSRSLSRLCVKCWGGERRSYRICSTFPCLPGFNTHCLKHAWKCICVHYCSAGGLHT